MRKNQVNTSDKKTEIKSSELQHLREQLTEDDLMMIQGYNIQKDHWWTLSSQKKAKEDDVYLEG